MPAVTAFQRQDDAYAAPADKEQLVAGTFAQKNGLTGLQAPFGKYCPQFRQGSRVDMTQKIYLREVQ